MFEEARLIFQDGGMSYKLCAIDVNSPGVLDDYTDAFPATADFIIAEHTILELNRVLGQVPRKLLIVGQLTDGTLVWNKANDGGIIIAHLRPHAHGLPRQTAPQLEIDLTQHGCFGTQRIRNTFGPSRWNAPGRTCFIIGVWDPQPDRWRLLAQIKDANQPPICIDLETKK